MSYRKFAKDVGIYGLTQVVLVISGIITLPVITKILGAENYGTWTQLMITMSMLGSFAGLGLPYALVRFLAGEKNQKQIRDGIWSVFAIILSLSLVISLFLVFFSGVISKFLGVQKIFINLLAIILIFDYLNFIFFNIFRAFQEIKKYCFFQILQAFAETGLIILSISWGYGLVGAVFSFLVIKIFLFLIMGGFIIQKIGFEIPIFSKTKEYLAFGLPNILSDVSSWILTSSDRYFIGFFWGTLYVGYYAPAYTLGGSMVYLIMPLGFLLLATLSKHYEENQIEKIKIWLQHSLKYFLAIAIPALFGMSVLAKPLLSVFSTPEIAQHSYFIVPIIALGMFLTGICGVVGDIIALKKKTYISGIAFGVSAFINFGLNFIFVPRFGIMGAALTTLIAYALFSTIIWYYSFKEIPFKIEWKFIFKSVFSSVIMSVFVFMLNPLGLWRTLGAVGLGSICYFTFMILLGGFDKKEIDFLKELRKSEIN